jgi:hydrogenase nickel incorporation protein HypB
MSIITIERKVLEKNNGVAALNRSLLQQHGVFAVNLLSSPGAGKTSILEQTLGTLRGRIRIGVIEGDVQTDLDARRVAQFEVPVVQIVTNGACHLEARLVQQALGKIDVRQLDLLVIENVGNLVCPASYDLGEAMKAVVVSTTEGDDKPLKYPGMFRRASVLLINKIDLLPYVSCNLVALKQNAFNVNPSLKVFETSCTNGTGIAAWCDWLQKQCAPSS